MPPNQKRPYSVPTYLTPLDAAIHSKNHEQEADCPFPVLTADESNSSAAKKGHDNGGLDSDIEADVPLKSTMESSINYPSLKQQQEDHHQHEHQRIKTMLRKYSSTVQDPEQFTLDEKRIQHALSDAGKHVYGIQGASVWIFDEDHDRLVLPPGGFWYHATNNEASDAMDAVKDHFRAHHQSSITPVAPGTDIAGLLWLEGSNHYHSFWHPPHLAPPDSSSSFLHHGHHQHHSPHKLGVDSTPENHHGRDTSHAAATATSCLVWRDIKSLVQDPDVAKGPSLVLLEQAGFGQAVGLPFHAGVCSGLVIFFVQSGLDPKLLNSTVHTAYLYQSAQFIGTAAALTEARLATIGQQMHETMKANCNTSESIDDEKNRNGTLVSELDQEGAKNERSEDKPISQTPTCWSLVRKRLHVWLSKTQGGGMQVPPALSTRQSLWTTFGAFCGLMVLAALNKIYQTLSDDYYFLLVEPFGALMTLQYGLTAAPASQPRSAIMGQAVAGAVSLSFTYIPEYILAEWLRRVIGPAIAIGVMVKLGFTHPPAGAHAIVYSSGKYNFSFYALVVLSTVISTIPATLVNNMSRKRQYPTFWGFPSFLTNLFSSRSKVS